jgi:nucleoid-associated protein YgaU
MKLNESTISMVLGAIVIVVVGFLIINYFKNIDTNSTLPPTETVSETALPTTHIVAEGEDLWSISENYYGTGYNWVDIAGANELANPGVITAGEELLIPAVEARITGNQLAQAITTSTPTPEPTTTKVPTPTTLLPTATPRPQITPTAVSTESSIEGNSYTVVRGDNLWKIAERAYGDGYRWVDIAKANKLVNPGIIHAGNVFVLPR